MKDGGFGYACDISRGNTLSRWSTSAASTFDTSLFAPIYRSRSGLPRQKIALPRQNRAWIFFRLKSSVDNLPLCRAIESKVADYPRSFTRRKIFHARVSDNPRSMTMTNLAPAYVSTCNSKRVIPPLSVTDRDVSQKPPLTSHSVTVRTVFSLFVLRIEMLSAFPWHCFDL